MFAKVYQYKFSGVSEAKVAASYCSDKLGKKIVEFDFEGLNIMIGKDGDLSIIIKFSESSKLKKFENVLLSPHNSNASVEVFNKVDIRSINNIFDSLEKT